MFLWGVSPSVLWVGSSDPLDTVLPLSSSLAKLLLKALAHWSGSLHHRPAPELADPSAKCKYKALALKLWRISVSKRYLHTNVHSSIIHNKQKVKATQYPSMAERINKMWFIHSTKYYSAFKSWDSLTHTITGMNLKDMMVSEISQSPSHKYHVIPFRWGTSRGQTDRGIMYNGVCQRWGEWAVVD